MTPSRLLQFQAKAAEVLKTIPKNGGAFYKQLMEKNQQFVHDPPSAEACSKLGKQLYYTSLASVPHRYQMLKSEMEGAKLLLKNWRGLSAEQYGLATLFGLECCAWFWLGEFVGRGFTVGYNVET